jgi:UPF0716 protein FxsA
MRLALLIVFIVFPLLEIALLVKLGSMFGFWPTFALVIGTAVLGSSILHHQGFAVLRRSQAALAEGHPPVEPVVDGLFLLIAGMFLITPGLITDSVGLVLLVPPVRRYIARWSVKKFLEGGFITGAIIKEQGEPQWSDTPDQPRGTINPQARRPSPRANAPVIDGEFERVDETTARPGQRGPDKP